MGGALLRPPRRQRHKARLLLPRRRLTRPAPPVGFGARRFRSGAHRIPGQDNSRCVRTKYAHTVSGPPRRAFLFLPGIFTREQRRYSPLLFALDRRLRGRRSEQPMEAFRPKRPLRLSALIVCSGFLTGHWALVGRSSSAFSVICTFPVTIMASDRFGASHPRNLLPSRR